MNLNDLADIGQVIGANRGRDLVVSTSPRKSAEHQRGSIATAQTVHEHFAKWYPPGCRR